MCPRVLRREDKRNEEILQDILNQRPDLSRDEMGRAHRILVARTPATPARVLEDLAKDKEPQAMEGSSAEPAKPTPAKNSGMPHAGFVERLFFHSLARNLQTGKMTTRRNSEIVCEAKARRLVAYARDMGWLSPEDRDAVDQIIGGSHGAQK
jgi:hypothetical protein